MDDEYCELVLDVKMKREVQLLIGVAQPSVGEVPLVEWCLMSVAMSKMSVVEVGQQHSLFEYLANTIQKLCVVPGLRGLIL